MVANQELARSNLKNNNMQPLIKLASFRKCYVSAQAARPKSANSRTGQKQFITP